MRAYISGVEVGIFVGAGEPWVELGRGGGGVSNGFQAAPMIGALAGLDMIPSHLLFDPAKTQILHCLDDPGRILVCLDAVPKGDRLPGSQDKG